MDEKKQERKPKMEKKSTNIAGLRVVHTSYEQQEKDSDTRPENRTQHK